MVTRRQGRIERRLAAILAADVAGYSRLTGLDEEGTIKRLRSLRRELISPSVALHRGRIVKTTGDGILIEFPSVVDAVRCALDVQRGMARRNADVPADRRIEFRVGINVGDVVVEGDDLVGDGVNVAARLEGISEPGGICMSEDAYRQVRDKLDVNFEDAGEQQLKNIARPVRTYRTSQQPKRESRPRSPVVVRAEPHAFCVLMGEDEAATRSALHRGRELVMSNLAHRDANIIRTSADTVIAVFKDAVEGVSAAVDTRDALARFNQNLPATGRVHYRFGIDAGALNDGPDGPYGDALERTAALVVDPHPDF